jgi:hypothetical protein
MFASGARFDAHTRARLIHSDTLSRCCIKKAEK